MVREGLQELYGLLPQHARGPSGQPLHHAALDVAAVGRDAASREGGGVQGHHVVAAAPEDGGRGYAVQVLPGGRNLPSGSMA